MVWSNDSTNSLVFPPGATSGARITIDQNGIIIYDANGNIVFAAEPNGNVPLGTAGQYQPVVVGGLGSPGLGGASFGAVEWWGRANGSPGVGDIFKMYIDGSTGPIGNSLPRGIVLGWTSDFGNAQNPLNSAKVAISATESDNYTISSPPFFATLQRVSQGIRINQTQNAYSEFKLGGGFYSAYLYSDYTHNDGLPNNTVVTLVPSTLVLAINDYGSGGYNPGTGVFTAPTDGIYEFHCGWHSTVAVAAGSPTGYIALIKNGTTAVATSSASISSTALGAGFTITRKASLLAGETMQVQAWQFTNTTLNIDHYFVCYRVI